MKLRKIIVLSLTLSSMLGMAQTAFGAEAIVDTRNNISSSVSLAQANTAFPSEEKLKELHNQMINNMMKDITENPKENKRIRREVLSDTGEQWYTARIGEQFTNDAQHYLTLFNRMHLVTDYKIYSGHAEIISTSTVGTRSAVPYTFSSQASSILNNNARTVSSQAEFVQTTSLGASLSSSGTYSIKTTITVKYADNGVITFVARSIVRG